MKNKKYKSNFAYANDSLPLAKLQNLFKQTVLQHQQWWNNTKTVFFLQVQGMLKWTKLYV